MVKRASRSLFITTLIVTLLLIVAISTATFAWFSASNIVNVSSISFIADSGGGGELSELAISWDKNAQNSARIFFAAPFEDDNQKLYPMMPIVAPTKGMTTFDQFAITGYSKNSGENQYSNRSFVYGVQVAIKDEQTQQFVNTYQFDGDYTHPYICKNKDDLTQSDFYLINKSTTFHQRVSIEYSISGGLSDKLCIAVFVEDIFIGVLTNLSGIHYGTIKKHDKVDDTAIDTSVCYKSTQLKFDIAKDSYKKIRLVAWYDGVTMDDKDMENTATLSMLRFNGDYTEPN